jgi:hypothetical protein
MEIEIKTIESTDGLYVSLEDIIGLILRMAWVCGSLPLSVLQNRLRRGRVVDGLITVKYD